MSPDEVRKVVEEARKDATDEAPYVANAVFKLNTLLRLLAFLAQRELERMEGEKPQGEYCKIHGAFMPCWECAGKPYV